MSETQAVARRSTKETIQKWLNSTKMQEFIRNSLPSMADPKRVMQVYYNVVSARPELQDCTAQSLLKVIIGGAQLGLSFDPNLKQAYIVPYGKEAQLQLGYKGLEKLAINSGACKRARSFSVHENDFFEYEEGASPRLVHRPALKDRGKTVGAYAVASMTDGTVEFKFMNLSEINEHRDRSKAKNNGPWKTDTSAMERKTVLRVLLNSLPLDEQAARGVGLDEASETDSPQFNITTADEILDAETIEEEEPKNSPKTKTETVKDALKNARTVSRSTDSPELAQQWTATFAALEAVAENAAHADLLVSEATDGKLQSVQALKEKGDIEAMKQVAVYAGKIADNQHDNVYESPSA